MKKLTQLVALASLSGAFAFVACGTEYGGPDPQGTAGSSGTTGTAGAPSTGTGGTGTAGAPSTGGATTVTAGAPSTGATTSGGGGGSSGGCNVGFAEPSGAALGGVALALALLIRRRRWLV